MALSKVKVEGDHFLYADRAEEFFYIGLSDFGQFKRMCSENGPEALVRPILVERRTIADAAGYTGPIVIRVFRTSHPNNPFGQTPDKVKFELINPFLDMCAEYKIYVDWTQGDDQYFYSNSAGLQDFHNKFCAEIKRFCFYETENEPFKNGEAPQHGIVPPPSTWYLRDSGNYVFINDNTQWPTQYDLEFISFHPDRNNSPIRWPKWVCDIDDSIAKLRSDVGKPTVLKEVNKFGAYYNDPAVAKVLGLRANMGGIGFHSQKGLESNGFDAATKFACGEYFKGVKGALG